MPTSEARIKANQTNALRSTGPRTQAGRERSRANACTHHLTARVVLDDADAVEVERRSEALTRELAPRTELGSILARKIAVTSVISEMATRAGLAASAERVRHASERFDEARQAQAVALLEALGEDPRGNLRKLRAMPEGAELMLNLWRDLRSNLARPGKPVWNAGQLIQAAKLLGIAEKDARSSRLGVISRAAWGDFAGLADSEGGGLQAEDRLAWARAQVLDVVDRSIAELEEHSSTLDAEIIAADRAEAGERALFDASKEGTLLRRYEAETSRRFYKAIKEFREAEAALLLNLCPLSKFRIRMKGLASTAGKARGAIDVAENQHALVDASLAACDRPSALATSFVCDDCDECEANPMAKRAKAASRSHSGPEMFAAHSDTQVIYCGDNLDKLRSMPTGMVDLIYIDPPFNSNRNYEVFWGETKEKRAFEDRHASAQAYIEFMRPRCVELHRVLKPTGSFYYHCDGHAGHYVKVMLDQIFSINQYRNEIIWQRTNAHSDGKRYGRIHDTILFYSKTGDYTWNTQYEKAGSQYHKAHDFEVDEDGRKYRKGDLTANKPGGDTSYEWKGVRPTKGRYWAYSKEKMEQFEAEGRIVYTRTGTPRLKNYVKDDPGIPYQDVWTGPDLWLNSGSKERIGYPTQKPIALLDRIIRSSSDPDDIVLDAFCGCGTALVAAQNLERRWIGIDISPTACRVMSKRLEDDCGLREKRDFTVRDMPHTVEFLRRIPHFEFENWAVVALGGIPNSSKVGDMGIDGRIYPVSATPERPKGTLGFMDHWYPIQVKQKDKAGRPDIDSFEAVMMREDRIKGFFVSFDYTADAETEIRAFFKRTGKVIVPFTVREIIEEEIAMRLA